MEDIGIWTNIHKTDKKIYGNIAYSATCSICKRTFLRMIYQLQQNNKKCHRHNTNFESPIKYPTVYGIGYNSLTIEEAPRTELYKRIYQKWRAMIYRCTEKFQNKYPTYKGVTCSKSWLDFKNFYYDVPSLPGYDFWVKNPNHGIMLDKDTVVEGNKIYSKETCCFISHAESNRDVNKRHPESLIKARNVYVEKSSLPIIAKNKITGEELRFSSLSEYGRYNKNGMRHVWMCLSEEEKYASHRSSKGFIFRFENEEFLPKALEEYERCQNKNKNKIKCPNCGNLMRKDSKCCTNCLKQIKRKDWPSKEELIDKINSGMNLSEICRSYGKSNHWTTKIFRAYGIPEHYKEAKEYAMNYCS